jgi:hypothetical protein
MIDIATAIGSAIGSFFLALFAYRFACALVGFEGPTISIAIEIAEVHVTIDPPAGAGDGPHK